MPALLQLLVTHPSWLAEHAGAYAELAAAEVADAAALCQRWLILALLTVFAFSLALGLAGVALMLWAVLPPAQHAWVLLATPALPLALGLAGLVGWLRAHKRGVFQVIRQQVQLDVKLLHEAASP